ncbi:MAG: hypothetical protein HYV68_03475, partial [Candidatus Taylorbacteria bacterium]|nr:hypothetical protein [Candidatus Taylorbacteria bacterium]
MGAIETDATSYGAGGLVFGTRSATTDTSPSERMRIDATGNVGIGTTSPYAKLSVEHLSSTGTVIGADALSTFTGNLLDLKVASSSKFMVNYLGNITTAGTFAPSGVGTNMLVTSDASGVLVSSSTPTAAAYYATSTTATSTFAGGFSAGNNAAFVVNQAAAANSLYVNAAGNVGVGTAGPSYKLDIVGDIKASTNFYLGSGLVLDSNGGNSVGDIDFYYPTGGAGVKTLGLFGNQDTTLNLKLADGILQVDGTGNSYIQGNVGIGTTSPQTKLNVDGGANDTYFKLSNSYSGGMNTDGLNIGIYQNGDAGSAEIWNWENGYLRFATNGSERLRITNSGNVGIGTTTPTSLLQVAGATAPKITLSDTDASADQKHWFIESNTGKFAIGTTSDALATNATYRALTIDSSGNVGVGATSPQSLLHVRGGDIRIDTAVTGSTKRGILFTGDTGATPYMREVFDWSSTDLNFERSADGSTWTNIMNLDWTNSYVGIGTTSPYAKLSVEHLSSTGTVIGTDALSTFTGNLLDLK